MTKKRWPKNFFDFSPIENAPDFKSLRSDLKNNILEDHLASLMKGIKDAEEGRLHYLGSFAKYAKEDDSE
jgi:hypothetical protein